MAVGDVVILEQFDFDGGNYAGFDPILGLVAAEDAGPPATADVLWETGETNSAVPQTQLRKVFFSGVTAPYIGKWVQLLGFPEFEPPDPPNGAPKSPSFSGVVVRAFTTGSYDAADPDADNDKLVLSQGQNAKRVMVEFDPLDNPLRIDNGRRAV